MVIVTPNQLSGYQKTGFVSSLNEANERLTAAKKATPIKYHTWFRSRIIFESRMDREDMSKEARGYYYEWVLR